MTTQIGADGKRYPIDQLPQLTSADIVGADPRIYGTPGVGKIVKWNATKQHAEWATAPSSGGSSGGLTFADDPQTYTFTEDDLAHEDSWYGDSLVKTIEWTPQASGELHLIPIDPDLDPDFNFEVHVYPGTQANVSYPDATAESGDFDDDTVDSAESYASDAGFRSTADNDYDAATMHVEAGVTHTIVLVHWDATSENLTIPLDALYVSLGALGGLSSPQPVPPFHREEYAWTVVPLPDGSLAVKPVWGGMPRALSLDDLFRVSGPNESTPDGAVLGVINSQEGVLPQVWPMSLRRANYSITDFSGPNLVSYATGSGGFSATTGVAVLSKGTTPVSTATLKDRAGFVKTNPTGFLFGAEVNLPQFATAAGAEWQFTIVLGSLGTEVVDDVNQLHFGFQFTRSAASRSLQFITWDSETNEQLVSDPLGSNVYDESYGYSFVTSFVPVMVDLSVLHRYSNSPGAKLRVNYCVGHSAWGTHDVRLPIVGNFGQQRPLELTMPNRWSAYLSSTSGASDVQAKIQGVQWSYAD